MADEKSRTKAGRFAKGRSGNPKGRAKLPEDYKLAIEKVGTEALSALATIVRNPAHPRHEQALEYALNRWKGMPRARTELTTPAGQPFEVAPAARAPAALTSDERRRELAAALARAALPVVVVAAGPPALTVVPAADDAEEEPPAVAGGGAA